MSKMFEWASPMLATLYHEAPFDDPEWIFEKKFDGVRCMAYFDGKSVRLMTRNKNEVTREYPEIAEEVAKLSKDPFVIDGEIVVEKGKIGSFGQMQNRIGVNHPSDALIKKYRLNYYVFDLLFLADKDLRDQKLIDRKKNLKKLHFTQKIHYTTHEHEQGKSFVQKMRKKEFEGAIAKKRSSSYLSKRSKEWLKLKCQMRQEFVIGGYTDPKGGRPGFGALLIGYYKDDDLLYAGKVGTGYTEKELKQLHKKLEKLKRKTSPFAEKTEKNEKHIHWIKPHCIAEVSFTEWTDKGRLRHPSFVGLREDKKPKNVMKE